ncbi:Zn-ribbon domain-containing OB-fold protein, partial [Enterobacter hormaechei]|uniref:Zn-ribbon domain-containing OB-fold protein n=1 Tax=Enterobacter hormaechei TaxID=158836 RepID=UPI001953DBDF
QCCKACKTWRWGPEWICHECHSFDTDWKAVEPEGTIFSWTRVWHPTHAVLNDRGPYIVVVVELPHAGK